MAGVSRTWRSLSARAFLIVRCGWPMASARGFRELGPHLFGEIHCNAKSAMRPQWTLPVPRGTPTSKFPHRMACWDLLRGQVKPLPVCTAVGGRYGEGACEQLYSRDLAGKRRTPPWRRACGVIRAEGVSAFSSRFRRRSPRAGRTSPPDSCVANSVAAGRSLGWIVGCLNTGGCGDGRRTPCAVFGRCADIGRSYSERGVAELCNCRSNPPHNRSSVST